MTWNPEFALFYVYTLVLFGALSLWAVPALVLGVVGVFHGGLSKRAPTAPKTGQQAQPRSQALSARSPHVTR